MNLATVIQENRKKKGLTQEQLAEMVGVSAPAVSKWESAGSFPDITLLAPIARALGVTVDTLVGFRPGLSEEEVNALEQECDELFRREGIEAGSARCEALLREYPNCAYLKLRIASVYQRAMLQLADGSEAALEPAYRRFYELFQQVYDSGDPRLHDAAAVILAGKALSDGDTARAEALLAELPQAEYKPDSLYPLLYLKKGETAKAVELLEKHRQPGGRRRAGAGLLPRGVCYLGSARAAWRERLFADPYPACKAWPPRRGRARGCALSGFRSHAWDRVCSAPLPFASRPTPPATAGRRRPAHSFEGVYGRGSVRAAPR